MQRRLGDALAVYVDAMRYPRGTENQRAGMWLEHVGRPGWRGVGVVETVAGAADGDDEAEPSAAELSDAPLLGVAYGYPGAPGQWWQQQVVQGLQRGGRQANDGWGDGRRLSLVRFCCTDPDCGRCCSSRGCASSLG